MQSLAKIHEHTALPHQAIYGLTRGNNAKAAHPPPVAPDEGHIEPLRCLHENSSGISDESAYASLEGQVGHAQGDGREKLLRAPIW